MEESDTKRPKSNRDPPSMCIIQDHKLGLGVLLVERRRALSARLPKLRSQEMGPHSISQKAAQAAHNGDASGRPKHDDPAGAKTHRS